MLNTALTLARRSLPAVLALALQLPAPAGDRLYVGSTDFGEVLWAFAGGSPSTFGEDFDVRWSGVVPSVFEHQHMVQRLDDDRLLFLDNGFGRALLFDLDETTREAQLVEHYPVGMPLPCGPQGTAFQVGSGHLFVGCADGPMLEYTLRAEEVWRGELSCAGGAFGAAVGHLR